MAKVIFGIQGVIWIVAIIIIIFLIIRRVKLKKEEDFEKRDS